jgi:hypothetical protein
MSRPIPDGTLCFVSICDVALAQNPSFVQNHGASLSLPYAVHGFGLVSVVGIQSLGNVCIHVVDHVKANEVIVPCFRGHDQRLLFDVGLATRLMLHIKH